MEYRDYKHALLKPDTHQRLKVYQYKHGLKSFDATIKKLLEDSEK